jgi:hypothetical protein
MATTKNTPSIANNDEPEPTEAESKMTEVIAKDRPAIDAAVKSFISIVCARTMAASATDATHDKVMMGIIPSFAKSSVSEKKSGSSNSNDAGTGENTNDKTSTQQQVLELARYILKAVNSYKFPIHDTVAYSLADKPGTSAEKKEELLEISVVARLWNALGESEQKPSRFLGRRALKLAWKNLDVVALFPPVVVENEEGGKIAEGVTKTEESDDNQQQPQPRQNQGSIDIRERQLEWLQQFEVLLFESTKHLPSDMKTDDDSALLWAPDGGAAELAKRRQRRLDAAKERGPSTPS